MKKIDAMHHFYGYGSGFCGECPHFREKARFKCAVYGITASEATDWRKSWIACGLIDKPFPGDEKRIFERITRDQRQDEQLPGQIIMDI